MKLNAMCRHLSEQGISQRDTTAYNNREPALHDIILVFTHHIIAMDSVEPEKRIAVS